MEVGIVGYGAYVPRHRIKVEEIAKVWGADAPSYKKGLMLREKSVPTPDQDTITMSVEAARHAIRRAGIDPARDRRDLRRLRVPSLRGEAERHRRWPRRSARRRTSTAPTSSSPARPGSEGMFVALSLVKAGQMDYALGDRRRHLAGRPGRRPRVLGLGGRGGLHLRPREAARGLRGHLRLHDRHAGLLAAGVPVLPAPRRPLHRRAGLLQARPRLRARADGAGRTRRRRTSSGPSSTSRTGSSPCARRRSSASPKEKVEQGWLSPTLGNTYSGSSPMGLTAILDVAKPGDRILMVSYGSAPAATASSGA